MPAANVPLAPQRGDGRDESWPTAGRVLSPASLRITGPARDLLDVWHNEVHMLKVRPYRSSWAALIVAAAMVLPPGLGAQNKPIPVSDLGWPRTYDVGTGKAVIYQPQVESWPGQTHMTAWSAVSYLPTGSKEPSLGTIKLETDTKVALQERLVALSDLNIAEANFPTLSREETQALVAGLKTNIPEGERVMGLDRVLAAVDHSSLRPHDASDIKADAPHVFYSTTPALLVDIDGDPVWSPIMGVALKFAVNTNWDLFQDDTTKRFYLRNTDNWLRATDIKGPWMPAGVLPSGFSKLPADDNWKNVRASLPGRTIASSAEPKVYVSTQPAELLLLRGLPVYQPVTGTSLMWVSNTDSDLFRVGKDGLFYYLVAGRWFSAPSLQQGPWTFATPELPADFKKIPVDHPRSRVLASVPGTDQAAEAVLLASVPQTARISKSLPAPEVSYEGTPQFEMIQGTSLSRAVNTDKQIIKVGDIYYLCFQAVWFMSRGPNGPWQVTGSVPSEIYEIPASSPDYNVTYVKVEDADPTDDWIDFGYTAGYTGMMLAWGTAVWGTGWYYPPYVGYAGLYPAYYGFAHTYGMGAWYNPWTGNFGRGGAVYGPFGGAGAGAVYNPRTGTYARGAAAYGPYGSRAVAQAWNPRTGTYGATRQGSNVYGKWGSSYVQRGDNWARTAHTTGPAGRTSVATGSGGNMYAGHDGNVYRKDAGGSWQKYSNGGWASADRTVGTAGRTGDTTRDWSETSSQLNRDSQARFEGAQRTRDFNDFQRSPTFDRAGSFRGGGFGGGGFGGGGFRGGGGGFRGGGRR